MRLAESAPSQFTLLVAGCRGGKTSFLRLLLDTSAVSTSATPDDVASVAKFVQGCSGHTTHIRTASIDVDVDLDGTGLHRRFGLNLIDTPTLDFADERAADRLVADTMHLVESRFLESVDDPRMKTGDGYVHLCLYFLDPEQIVPSHASPPPTLPLPRVRGNSFSQTPQEPVILEPPNPLYYRPTVPNDDVTTIRRLSMRCNVLPVIAKADTLSNDRLSAVKLAIRRDLAEAGIGFGIFDESVSVYRQNGDPANGYRNGTSSTANSPPTSPISPTLKLPYALISPDLYSHSDGVPRPAASRQQLMNQYAPSYSSPLSKLSPGTFIRSYRWGFLDVLDPAHCDFLPLRNAVFHHMNTLQTYTRDYLFNRFQQDYAEQHPPRHPASAHVQGIPHPGALSSRPVLAIDTAGPHSSISRNPSVPVSREMSAGRDIRSVSLSRPMSDISVSASTKGLTKAKQRTKKITVACNFCRSRKLKCDGGRPACSQCVKRQNPCDYMPQSKRRGGVRTHRDDSASDSGDDEPNTTPVSEAPSMSISRRTSNAGRMTPMPMGLSTDPSTSSSGQSHSRFFPDNELPHIATLSLPDRSPGTPLPMSAPPLPPIRPVVDPHTVIQRKRAQTAPGRNRQPSTSGPKVVACNFCRARKTKCDGGHPACSSCVRRSLACNYVNDRNGGGVGADAIKKPGKRPPNSLRPSPPSPPSSRMVPTPLSGNDGDDAYLIRAEDEQDTKRSIEHSDMRPPKKMRMEG
ncbi:hypothetical protein CPB85DRAFT_1327234 [Mucidula mucida]|nr:hypothetical protein CPB85DRAFT_1327234 [Mucidula mucida]